MKFNKQLIFFIAILVIVLTCNSGYCQSASYDSDEMHKIVREKCEEFFQKERNKIREIDKNYEVSTNDVDTCECSVYASYKVFGKEYLDDFIKNGTTLVQKYLTPENADKFQRLSFECMEKN